jgi:hypothetical protein
MQNKYEMVNGKITCEYAQLNTCIGSTFKCIKSSYQPDGAFLRGSLQACEVLCGKNQIS